MNGIDELVQAHINISKLETEIKKCRNNLINQHKNTQNTNTNLDIYISKVTYNGLAQQIKQETAKFDKLLQNLNVSQNSKAAEIIDNIESESSSTQSNIMNAYSVSITDNDTQTIKTEDQKKKKVTKKQPKKKKPVQPIKSHNKKQKISKPNANNNTKVNKNVTLRKTVRPHNKRKPKTTPAIVNNKLVVKPMMVINNVERVKVNKPQTKTSKNNRNQRVKGFEVYKNKPIYSSILLFCKETCGRNNSNLRKYLIKYGNFDERKIEQIIFRTNYALISVRGPLNIIQQKMDILNTKKGNMFGDVIEFHKPVQFNDYSIKPQKVLYINNFDILDGTCHMRFTNLFSSFGELKQHVIMGRDKKSNPFAIVQFKHLKNTKECVKYAYNQSIVFDGKTLNIKYSQKY